MVTPSTRISIDLEQAQLEQALIRLAPDDQLRLAKLLAARQVEDVVSRLRRTVKRKGLSAAAIRQLVREARRTVYGRRGR